MKLSKRFIIPPAHTYSDPTLPGSVLVTWGRRQLGSLPPERERAVGEDEQAGEQEPCDELFVEAVTQVVGSAG